MIEIFGLTLGEAAACTLVVYIGAVVQAATGVGVGIVASPVLIYVDPAFVPVVIPVAVLPLALTVAYADRDHIDRPGVVAATIGRIPGALIGAWIVTVITDDTLAILVSATVLLGVFASVTTRRFEPTNGALVAGGFASGVTGTAVGVGGPPIAMTYQHSDPVTMRASISLFFAFGAVVSAIALALAGEFGRRQVELIVLLLPAIIAGVATARWHKNRLTGPFVRPVVLGLSAFSAIALAIRTLL